MGVGVDDYKSLTDILHQYPRISTQNVQIDAYARHSHRNKCLLQRFLSSTVFYETVKEYVSIMK